MKEGMQDVYTVQSLFWLDWELLEKFDFMRKICLHWAKRAPKYTVQIEEKIKLGLFFGWHAFIYFLDKFEICSLEKSTLSKKRNIVT